MKLHLLGIFFIGLLLFVVVCCCLLLYYVARLNIHYPYVRVRVLYCGRFPPGESNIRREVSPSGPLVLVYGSISVFCHVLLAGLLAGLLAVSE